VKKYNLLISPLRIFNSLQHGKQAETPFVHSFQEPLSLLFPGRHGLWVVDSNPNRATAFVTPTSTRRTLAIPESCCLSKGGPTRLIPLVN